MGLFKKKNPQDAFDPDVFTITDTILDPPRFTFLPAIYQDATRRKWAVHQRGAEPKIFDYADVLQCEIVETGNPEDVPELNNRELAQQILINPAQATKYTPPSVICALVWVSSLPCKPARMRFRSLRFR